MCQLFLCQEQSLDDGDEWKVEYIHLLVLEDYIYTEYSFTSYMSVDFTLFSAVNVNVMDVWSM